MIENIRVKGLKGLKGLNEVKSKNSNKRIEFNHYNRFNHQNGCNHTSWLWVQNNGETIRQCQDCGCDIDACHRDISGDKGAGSKPDYNTLDHVVQGSGFTSPGSQGAGPFRAGLPPAPTHQAKLGAFREKMVKAERGVSIEDKPHAPEQGEHE